jgi:hypothetical protein
MANSYKNIVKGIGLVPNATTQNTTKGDLETLTTDTKLHFYTGTINDPIVGEATIATLTGKTINGPDNTLTNIANSSLSNSSLTVNGQTVSLGGSTTVTATATNALTIGTGLSGTSYNGSAPITIAIDSTVVTLTGSQVLTNKTLSGNTAATLISGSGTLTLPTSGTITIPSGTDTLVNLTGSQVLTNKTITGTFTGTSILAANGQLVTLQASPSASATYAITMPAAAPTASTALVFDGTNFVWSTAGGWLVNSSLSLGAGGTIAISITAGQQVFTVSSSGGNVSLAGAAFGSSAPVNGATVRLIGISDTNTVSLVDTNSAKGLRLNGNATLVSGSVIEFQYILSSDIWFETFRNF